jgi:hypothetical protein
VRHKKECFEAAEKVAEAIIAALGANPLDVGDCDVRVSVECGGIGMICLCVSRDGVRDSDSDDVPF